LQAIAQRKLQIALRRRISEFWLRPENGEEPRQLASAATGEFGLAYEMLAVGADGILQRRFEPIRANRVFGFQANFG